MRVIFRIARLELSTMFFSPIAWLVLIIFTFQCGMTFSDLLQQYVSGQTLGRTILNITFRLFSDGWGSFFDSVQSNLYLYIPLLTMGVLSRELSSGSIKLLQSSPIRTTDIVIGKFLALVVYCAILIVILFFFVIAGGFSIENLDYGLLLSALTGIFLLACTYCAIGLFMSSLTTYQVVAAISTLAVLAALNFIGKIGQDSELVRSITYFLSLSGRTHDLVLGLINSKEIFYFLIIIILFLTLTIFKLQAQIRFQTLTIKAGRYLLLFGIILVLGFLTSRPALTGYYDATATKTQTLTANSQEVLKRMTQPLKITAFVNINEWKAAYALPKNRNYDFSFWDKYRRLKPDMSLDYVYYYDTSSDARLWKDNPGLSVKEVAAKSAEAYGYDFDMFLSPEEIKKRIDLSSEENRFVRLLDYQQKKTFLRMFDDMAVLPGEAEITAAFKRLVVTPPKIAFLTGHNERAMNKAGDKDYKMITKEVGFRYSLINQGFDVVDLDLKGTEIPKDIAVLVIADPKSPIGGEDLSKITRYIDSGGNMMIAGEPGKQSILNPLLNPIGVQLMDGVLIQESKDFSPDLVFVNFATGFGKYTDRYQKLLKDDKKVSVSGAAGLGYQTDKGFHTDPIVVTEEKNTWNKQGQFVMDTGKVTFNLINGDSRKPLPVALALTRKTDGKEQRIMVLGDADFMSNAELRRNTPQTANFSFAVELFKWFSYGEFPLNTDRPDTYDNKMLIQRSDVSTIRNIFLGVIPLLMIITAAIILIRRKRR